MFEEAARDAASVSEAVDTANMKEDVHCRCCCFWCVAATAVEIAASDTDVKTSATKTQLE